MELSQPQQQAVLAIVREHPEYNSKRIAEEVRKSTTPPQKVEHRLVLAFLRRKGLKDIKARQALEVNEVDRV